MSKTRKARRLRNQLERQQALYEAANTERLALHQQVNSLGQRAKSLEHVEVTLNELVETIQYYFGNHTVLLPPTLADFGMDRVHARPLAELKLPEIGERFYTTSRLEELETWLCKVVEEPMSGKLGVHFYSQDGNGAVAYKVSRDKAAEILNSPASAKLLAHNMLKQLAKHLESKPTRYSFDDGRKQMSSAY